ncbi:MAG: ABC transporter permease subunit [Pseudomonadota bacterium]
MTSQRIPPDATSPMSNSLRTIGIVFAREFFAYFKTPLAAIFLFVFLALAAGLTFFATGFFTRGQADLASFFTWHPWLFLILMPAIGMRLWAEERRSGTIELLMTLPVRTWELVVAKFLAGWAFVAVALICTFPMWWTVNYLGAPDNGVIFASYVGSWLMAGAFLALAACISAMTKNQVIAFIVAGLIGFLLVMAGFDLVLSAVRGWAPTFVTDAVQSLSFISHFNRLSRGVIELPTVIFFISMILLCLWINIQVVDLKKAA